MGVEPRRDRIRAVATLKVIKWRSVREPLQSILRCGRQMLHLIVIESSAQLTEKALHFVRGLLQVRGRPAGVVRV